MKSIAFALRRPVATLMLVVALVSCGALALNTVRPDIFPSEVHNFLASIHLSPEQIKGFVAGLVGHGREEEEQHHEEAHKILATSPQLEPVTLTLQYVCQIHSKRHIEVRALKEGYLEEIHVKEGQRVEKGDVLFAVIPILYQKEAEAAEAEAKVARMELNYGKQLRKDNAISQNEVLLIEAKLARAEAKAELAKAALHFASIRAPFDGIIDRLLYQQGALVEEGGVLTTLSDNSVMWVYFNVPEKRYLEYMANLSQDQELPHIELKLADASKFQYLATNVTIEGQFNNQTGNIPFRADFPNPDRLLRHGQTGTVLISRVRNDALVIPQRATFEILDKRYVWVIDEDDVVHQRLVTIDPQKLEDIFVVKSGLDVNEKIVLDGVRQVHDGDKVEYEERDAKQVDANLKYHAE